MIEAIIMAACLWVGYWLGRKRVENTEVWLQSDIVKAARRCKTDSKFHGSDYAITLYSAVREIEGDKYVIGVAPAQSGWQMVMEYKGDGNEGRDHLGG